MRGCLVTFLIFVVFFLIGMLLKWLFGWWGLVGVPVIFVIWGMAISAAEKDDDDDDF